VAVGSVARHLGPGEQSGSLSSCHDDVDADYGDAWSPSVL
jgi:hypothetical protein